jgi:uncharacterized protein YndB with AHSA1/START domain
MILVDEETIEAGPDLVWRHLTTPELMTAWMPGIESMRTRDGGPLRAGSELIFRARGADRVSDVVEYRAGERLTLRSSQGPYTATYVYEIARDGAVTRIRLRAECSAKGAAKFIVPFIRAMIRRVDGAQLKALKTQMANTDPPQGSGQSFA